MSSSVKNVDQTGIPTFPSLDPKTPANNPPGRSSLYSVPEYLSGLRKRHGQSLTEEKTLTVRQVPKQANPDDNSSGYSSSLCLVRERSKVLRQKHRQSLTEEKTLSIKSSDDTDEQCNQRRDLTDEEILTVQDVLEKAKSPEEKNRLYKEMFEFTRDKDIEPLYVFVNTSGQPTALAKEVIENNGLWSKGVMNGLRSVFSTSSEPNIFLPFLKNTDDTYPADIN